MALTAKQSKFVSEYLVDSNGKQAAIRAGYARGSAEVEASRLLKNAKVAAAIAEAQKRIRIDAAAQGITPDRVLSELAKIAFADIRKVVKWRSDGVGVVETEDGEERIVSRNEVTLVNSEELPDEIAAAVGEVSQAGNGALKIKMHDKHAALVDLAKHLGLFVGTGTRGGAEKAAGGKKDQANRAAETAGNGTDWGDDLQVPQSVN